MILEVVFLRRGISRPFYYSYAGAEAPLGCPVVVPLNNQLTVGVVIGRLVGEPDFSTDNLKAVEAVVDTVKPLPEDLLKLGLWMADYYLAPVNQLFSAILPPRYLPRPRVGWEVVEPEEISTLISAELAAEVSGTARITLKKLKEQLDLSEAEIVEQLDSAVERGALREQLTFERAPSSRRRLNFVSLQGSKEKIAGFMTDASHRQRELIEHLRESGDSFQADLPRPLKRTGLLNRLEEEGLIRRKKKHRYRMPLADFRGDVGARDNHQLTGEQQQAVDAVSGALQRNSFEAHLLHGVTGSGKTEVYFRLIETVLEKGLSALVLVPEITLAAFLFKRFHRRFSERLALLHSGLSAGERRDEWERIQRGEASVVLGVQSAVFAPISKLGLIIVDEEHDSSFKAGGSVRYHARDVAVKRAQLLDIPILLGSATPSIESYSNACRGRYEIHKMVKRPAGGELPEIKKGDLRGESSLLTASLVERTEEVLQAGNRAIWFLNRRGYSNFLICSACGEPVQCRDCQVSMTYHSNPGRLRCHYCGYASSLPDRCPDCEKKQLKLQGTGTQQLERIARKLYPEAKIIRMDADTVKRKNSRIELFQEFERSEAALLLGTQMVTKGLDFERIDFVGVINVDTGLNFPDFRAGEKTFQQLVQVCGRAGREQAGADVLVQTYNPRHYSIQLAARGDYQNFARKELLQRRSLNYPPFSRLIDFVAVGPASRSVEKLLRALKSALPASSDIELLGPVPCGLEKIKNRYRWHLLVRGKITLAWRRAARKIIYQKLKIPRNSRIIANVDPVDVL